MPQGPPGHGGGIGVQQGLGELDVPVAELVPGKLVEPVRRIVEAVFLQRGPDGLDGLVELGQDPGIGKAEVRRAGGHAPGIEVLGVRQDELARVPDLVDEEAVSLDAFVADPHVPAHGREGGEREPERVGSVLVHLDDGVHDVAL